MGSQTRQGPSHRLLAACGLAWMSLAVMTHALQFSSATKSALPTSEGASDDGTVTPCLAMVYRIFAAPLADKLLSIFLSLSHSIFYYPWTTRLEPEHYAHLCWETDGQTDNLK